MSFSEEPLLRTFSSEEENDKICYEPSIDSIDGKSQSYLIYFLPGNPGLIRYYQPFLLKLYTLLSTRSTTQSSIFHICGHSHSGFETAHDGKKFEPLGLGQQVKDQEQRLYNHIESHRNRFGQNPKVILMGHSVGCYMLLELIQQHRNKIQELIEQHGSKPEEGEEDFDLIGGILLFPTITHIAKSPLGMVFGVCTLDALIGLLLKLCDIENSSNSVFPSSYWKYRESFIVPDPGKHSLSACQASDQVPRVRSNNHYLVHQKPDGGQTGFVRVFPPGTQSIQLTILTDILPKMK